MILAMPTSPTLAVPSLRDQQEVREQAAQALGDPKKKAPMPIRQCVHAAFERSRRAQEGACDGCVRAPVL